MKHPSETETSLNLLDKINLNLTIFLKTMASNQDFSNLLQQSFGKIDELVEMITKGAGISLSLLDKIVIFTDLVVALNVSIPKHQQIVFMSKLIDLLEVVLEKHQSQPNVMSKNEDETIRNLMAKFRGNIINFKSGMAELMISANQFNKAEKQLKEAKKFFQFYKQKNLLDKHSLSLENFSNLSFYSDKCIISVRRNQYRKAMKFASSAHSIFDSTNLGRDKFVAATKLIAVYSEFIQKLFLVRNFRQALSWSEACLELLKEHKRNLELMGDFKANINQVDITYLQKENEQRKNALLTARFEMLIQNIPLVRANENFLIIIELLKPFNYITCEYLESGTAVFHFEDSDKLKLFLSKISHNKFVTVIKDNEIHLEILAVEPYYIKKLLNRCCQALLQDSSQQIHCYDEYTSLQTDNRLNEPSVQREKAEKPSKEKEKEKEKESTKSVKQNAKSKKTRIVTEIRLEDGTVSSPKKLNRVFGAKGLVFSRFDKAAIATVGYKQTVETFFRIAERGKVLNSDNARGKQGYVPCKTDSNLVKKYGEQYTWKLKALGDNGDHRFLGRTIMGTLFKLQGDEILDSKPCSVIDFDLYLDRGHKY
jgi:hypothetical protein